MPKTDQITTNLKSINHQLDMVDELISEIYEQKELADMETKLE
jgi:hypothetical protein